MGRWLRGYLFVSVTVFAAGIGLGWLLSGEVSLTVLAEFGTNQSLFPSRITVKTILLNNLVALAVVLAGVITFAVTTAVSLLFNGLLIGFLLGATDSYSLVQTIALILPHGLLELPAFWVAGAVAFRVTHRLIRYLRGNEDEVLGPSERYEAVLLGLLTVVLIIVAAVIEARFTLEIAEWLTGRTYESP
jgi:stage II sporulation protein M